MFLTLREFIAALETAGELHRVEARVSPLLEISHIADRVSKEPAPCASPHAALFDPQHFRGGGKALLFENVEGSIFPVLINAFGSYRRMEIALGCTEGGFESLAAKIAHLIKPEPPVGLMDKLKKGMELVKIAGLTPRLVRSGLCQEVVKTGAQINLFELPIIKCWPRDGDPRQVGYSVSPEQAGTTSGDGKYITFAGVYTIHPDDAGKPDDQPRPSRNVGMYRAQLIDPTHTAMHWHMHHDGARHWRAWKKLDEERRAQGETRPGMPCALVFGGESVLPYVATAPMPPGISELLLAGFLHGSGIELVRCQTIDMHIPAHAEIVIEGYVSTLGCTPGGDPRLMQPATFDPQSSVFEGPFGDHTGFYSLPDRYPVFTVTAVTHRRNPIYPTTIVGLPPQEDYYLGKATERIFLPLLRTLIPDILDYHLPMFGCFHNCAFLKIKKEYPLQARRVMHAVWGAGQMAWTKLLVVVDEDVDVHDEQQVLLHLCANCDPGRDVELVHGPLDILDHAAPRLGAGTKMGCDATKKIPGEEVHGHPIRDFPPLITQDSAMRDWVEKRWQEYGF